MSVCISRERVLCLSVRAGFGADSGRVSCAFCMFEGLKDCFLFVSGIDREFVGSWDWILA